jgi:hypothetical protein
MLVTQAIAAEHVALQRVFDEIERALPDFESAAELGRLARILENVLRTHGKLETKLAFLPLDHALHHQTRLGSLHHDHREVDEQLRLVQRAATCEQARGRLRRAIAAARAHFRTEEQRIFPVLERTLPGSALEALGAAFERAPTALARQMR